MAQYELSNKSANLLLPVFADKHLILISNDNNKGEEHVQPPKVSLCSVSTGGIHNSHLIFTVIEATVSYINYIML